MLELKQQDGGSFAIDEQLRMKFSSNVQSNGRGFPAIIEEHVRDEISKMLSFGSFVLDKFDETQKLGRVVVTVVILGGEYMTWRTLREHNSSPDSFSLNSGFSNSKLEVIHLSPPDFPRTSLGFSSASISEDLVTLLKRQASR